MYKIVYKYDPDSYEYIGTEILNEDDISPLGDWNIPAYCTELPVTEKIGYTLVFNESLNEWNYVVQERPKIEEQSPEEIALEKYVNSKYEPVLYNEYWYNTNTKGQKQWFAALALSEISKEVEYKVYTDEEFTSSRIIKISREELLKLGSIVREKQLKAYKEYKNTLTKIIEKVNKEK